MNKRIDYKRAIHAAKGMVYLESKGVVHRDLACRNLLVLNSNWYINDVAGKQDRW